jgi:hypothetical protein
VGFTDGFGGAARFNQPYGVTVDGSGNVFVADTYNRAVRKITAAGAVTTLNGTNSRFYYPQGITADGAGNLYVADGDNQSVSKGVFVTAPPSGSSVASPTVTSGQIATFTLGAAIPQTTYQWQVSTNAGANWDALSNNSTYAGATTTTLTAATTTAMTGYLYRAQLANAAGTSVSGTATLTVTASSAGPTPTPTGATHLAALSVRTFVGTGDSTVSVGFGISGSGSKQVLIRGVGPTLAGFGVSGVLLNPVLGLYNSSSALMSTNAGWGGGVALADAFVSAGTFALPINSVDTALFQSLAAGTFYSALISGANATTGIALAEIYDVDPGTPATRLTSISARALSGTGSSVLIAGFIIEGNGTEVLLIRGIGPTLTQYGVSGVLASTQLTLFNGASQAIGTNAGWGGGSVLATAFAQYGLFALPANSADSAMIVSLPPGLYTVQLSGTNNTSGIGLIEVYEMH